MGSDSVLLDLKILNGDMFLKFDKYVNNYTVNVASDVDTLEIEYKIRDTDEIRIVNNEILNYGLNYVFLEVTSEEEKNVYTLEVYKEKIENVMKYEDVLVAKSDKEANEKRMKEEREYKIKNLKETIENAQKELKELENL